MRIALLTVWCTLHVLFGLGQSFSDIAASVGVSVNVYDNLHGAGVSFVDFDQDGDDDLTFCEDGQIKVYRNQNGVADLVDFGFVVDDNAKHPVWVDYDNDGDLDFYFTQAQHPNKLYEQSSPGVFTDVTENAGLTSYDDPSYGCAWGDYDRDGDLDLYVSNYVYVYEGGDEFNYYNHLYRNQGDGTFTDVTLASGTTDGISLSFQSIWTDVDNDGWPDLYVINDLEHPNRLYHNQGDGTFLEIGDSSNSAITIVDAMSATCGDFNNDGYEDIYITNVAIQPCVLLLNNGDLTFTNVSATAGTELWMLCWGASWLDFDLDMDLDLYVAENHYLFPNQANVLLKNNGEQFFENVGTQSFVFDQTNSYCSAVGDWNGDAQPDIAVNNWEGNNASLWENSGSLNRWLKVKLEGTVSNNNGIGARIECWADETLQSRQLYCGEAYMGQNSETMHFGLAQLTHVDSLNIHWPSGFTDEFGQLDVNQLITVSEGSTWEPIPDWQPEYILCSGDSLEINLDGTFDASWSDGTEGNSNHILAGESLVVTVVHELGFTKIYQTTAAISEGPVLQLMVTDVYCAGEATGQITLSDQPDLSNIAWENGDLGLIADTLGAGWISFTYQNADGCSFTDSAFVEETTPLLAEWEVTSPLCHDSYDGIIDIDIGGGTAPVTQVSSDDLSSVGQGVYDVVFEDSLGCQWSEQIVVIAPDSISITWEVDCQIQLSIDITPQGGTEPYDFSWSDGSNLEDPTNDLLECLSVMITDNQGCTFSSDEICCPTSIDELEVPSLFHPNPVGDVLYYNAALIASMTLFDVSGKLLREIPVSQGQSDMTWLQSGEYVVLIQTVAGERVAVRLIKL